MHEFIYALALFQPTMIQSSSSFANPLSRHFARWMAIGTVSTAGLLLGWVPEFLPQTSFVSWNHAAQAQSVTVTDAEVRNYAESVLAIESLRQNALTQIQQLLPNRQVPAIRCDERSSLNGLSRPAREIAVNYCNSSQRLVESNDLTSDRFNQITRAQQSDRALAARIREALIQAQQNR